MKSKHPKSLKADRALQPKPIIKLAHPMQDGSFHNRSKPSASTGLVPNLQVKRGADSLRLRNPTEFGDYLHGQVYRLDKGEDFILLMLAGTRINKEFTPGERAGTSHSGSIYYRLGFGAASCLPSLQRELGSRRFPRALHPGCSGEGIISTWAALRLVNKQTPLCQASPETPKPRPADNLLRGVEELA